MKEPLFAGPCSPLAVPISGTDVTRQDALHGAGVEIELINHQKLEIAIILLLVNSERLSKTLVPCKHAMVSKFTQHPAGIIKTGNTGVVQMKIPWLKKCEASWSTTLIPSSLPVKVLSPEKRNRLLSA